MLQGPQYGYLQQQIRMATEKLVVVATGTLAGPWQRAPPGPPRQSQSAVILVSKLASEKRNAESVPSLLYAADEESNLLGLWMI
jgi:hypothetical protein